MQTPNSTNPLVSAASTPGTGRPSAASTNLVNGRGGELFAREVERARPDAEARAARERASAERAGERDLRRAEQRAERADERARVERGSERGRADQRADRPRAQARRARAEGETRLDARPNEARRGHETAEAAGATLGSGPMLPSEVRPVPETRHWPDAVQGAATGAALPSARLSPGQSTGQGAGRAGVQPAEGVRSPRPAASAPGANERAPNLERPAAGSPARARAKAAEASPAANERAEQAERAASIVRQFRAALRPGMQRATLELHPKELGSISIQLALSGGGVSAHVRAQSSQTLADLERHAPELRAALERQGLRVGELRLELDSARAGVGERARDTRPRAGARPTQTGTFPGIDALA